MVGGLTDFNGTMCYTITVPTVALRQFWEGTNMVVLPNRTVSGSQTTVLLAGELHVQVVQCSY
jgi:hypothetical protein